MVDPEDVPAYKRGRLIPGIPGTLYRLKPEEVSAGVFMVPIIEGKGLLTPDHRIELRDPGCCLMYFRPPTKEEHFDYRAMSYQFDWVVLYEEKLWITTSYYFMEVPTTR